MEAIYETAGGVGGREQHPTSLEEEMPFLPPPLPALEEECNFFTAKGRALPPFVALYFAECPVRVTDKGLCEGKMQPERNSNNEDG